MSPDTIGGGTPADAGIKPKDVMQGPFTVDVNVYLTNGENTAIAKCTLPVGEVPSSETIMLMVATAEKQTMASAGNTFRLMTRNEFENEIISERIGPHHGTFATKDSWDPA